MAKIMLPWSRSSAGQRPAGAWIQRRKALQHHHRFHAERGLKKNQVIHRADGSANPLPHVPSSFNGQAKQP
jgi:hypothetical protein